ncbi:hypothetical protein KY290_001765 [Solanum tuberosum]|uniref:Cytochrome c oxidase subunit 5C n=1 Tax=Solanum tuberosum TaxID=4113 RepID=A0ABQ7WN43_SOLTU|nr:hypothetical protein KY284_001802 [Solanum tuberosum]KAH0782167.1 hypothetical protein KY290_001765 [Solanum tuberosum]
MFQFKFHVSVIRGQTNEWTAQGVASIDGPKVCYIRNQMAGHRIAHATLKGPSVVKEIVIASVLGLAAGSLWKMHHWNEQRKVRSFYDLLEKGEISIVVEE